LNHFYKARRLLESITTVPIFYNQLDVLSKGYRNRNPRANYTLT